MPSSKSLVRALAAFHGRLAIEGFTDLRDAFAQYADSNGDDLAGAVIGFVRARGVHVPGYQVVCHLLGVGPHRFHHGKPNLARVFQADMHTLADMVRCGRHIPTSRGRPSHA